MVLICRFCVKDAEQHQETAALQVPRVWRRLTFRLVLANLEPGMFIWTTAVATLLLAITLWFGWQLWLIRRRNGLILRMLDDADKVEARLLECREKMKTIGAMLGRLPTDITASARATLDSESGIQQALKVVLQHRLWIRENANTAPVSKLVEVSISIRRSLEQLNLQISRLSGVGDELAAAYVRSDAVMSGGARHDHSKPRNGQVDHSH